MVRRFCAGSRLPPDEDAAVLDYRSHRCGKKYLVAGHRRDLAIWPRRNQFGERALSFCAPTFLSAARHARRRVCSTQEEKKVLPTARLATVLTQVGLGSLVNELDAVQDWSQRLSPGEQQRFAFARIFLMQPALLFSGRGDLGAG